MKALVTGGGGFLGKVIIKQLLARGDHVRNFSRSAYPELEALGVECVQGDLQNAADVAKACEGMDVVFHVAANHDFWGKYELLYGINVKGTENIIQGCLQASVPKLVYTSTPSVVFPMGDLCGVDESQPYPDKYYANYPKTKAEAEQKVLAANGDKLLTCALRPHLIWGVDDPHIIPMVTEKAKTGQLTKIGAGENIVDLCYVDNAAHAHLLAADHLTSPDSAPAGKAYFISDDNPVKLWDWIETLLDRLDLPQASKQISEKKAYILASILEVVHTLLPFLGAPRVTRFIASNFATSHYFDISAAKKDFNYELLVDNDEGLKRTVDWYKKTFK